MKTYLTLILMMISTFAWAMPSAKYIPADAATVTTFHIPQGSTFMKEWNTFAAQNKESPLSMILPVSTLHALNAYGISPEMQGDFVFINILGDEDKDVMFIEGTFDADVVLAKMRQSPDALNELFREEGLVCGKMPGGIYICSGQIVERVKALLAGKEEPISPTSAFAKLVDEKNDPNRLAIRALGKGGKGGWELLREGDLSAAKVSLIEHTPGVVGIDAKVYAKTIAPLTRIDTLLQGYKMVLAPFMEETPALKQFVNQVKTTVDTAKKRLTLSGSVTVKDLEVFQEAWHDFIGSQVDESIAFNEDDDISLITSPTFTIENVEDFASNWKPRNLDQSKPFALEGHCVAEQSPRSLDKSKTFTFEGHRITVTAENQFLHLRKDGSSSSSFSSPVVDHIDDPTQLSETKDCMMWSISSPATVEIQKMHVTQGDKSFEFNRDSTFPSIDLEKGTQDVSCLMIGRPTGDVDVAFEYHIIPVLKTSSVFQVGKLENLFDSKEGQTFTIEDHTVIVSVRRERAWGGQSLDAEIPRVKWEVVSPKDLEIKDMDIVTPRKGIGHGKGISPSRTADKGRRTIISTTGRPTDDVEIVFHYHNWTGHEK